MIKKTIHAAEKFDASSIVLSGGVAANQILRDTFQTMLDTKYKILGTKLFVPPRNLCTDNAAMIASAGFFRHITSDWQTLRANPQLYFD